MTKWYDRIIMLIYGIIVACSSLLLLTVAFGWIASRAVHRYIDNVYELPLAKGLMIAVAALLALISVRLIFWLARSGGEAASVDQTTAYGDVRISFDTIRSLAMQVAGRSKGLSDVKARIRVRETGLQIELRVVVDGQRPIPQVTEETQQSVKEHVEEMTGIPVDDVSVIVHQLSAPTTSGFKSRLD